MNAATKTKPTTVSNIELKRWMSSTDMIDEKFPIYADIEDDRGYVKERYEIIGCTSNGEFKCLRLRLKQKFNN